ncbi:MAG: tRNA pseudouridine(54/55) synthase Pus10 [Thermoplasmata archaeon]
MELQLWEGDLGVYLKAALTAKPLCVSCVGRLFARIGTGITNRERGRQALSRLQLDAADECWLCEGLAEEISKFADLVMAELANWDFDTFLVGCRLDPDLLDREETLWAELGLRTYEPIKAEINREVGKIVERRLGRRAEFSRPDVTAIISTMLDHVEVQVAPLYIYGRYRKLVRGIPQTRWPCRRCRGVGCEKCDFKGKLYDTSVEEIIAEHVIREARAESHSFHGMGREDIDARMLGSGRPFVLELHRPGRRKLDLEALAERINGSGQVEVEDLRPSNREEVVAIKGRMCDKSYGVLIQLGEEVALQKVKEAVEALKAGKIVQRTPTRVAHRRADKERIRRVLGTEIGTLRGSTLELRLRTEAGTYVKELIHGDEGRTRPSLAELLGTEAQVVELDVLEVHDEELDGKGL